MTLHRSRLRLTTSAVLLTGCFTQHPLETMAPRPETHIIAQVTTTGAVDMEGQIGPAPVEVEGVVAQADANGWQLHLLRVDHRGGTSVAWNRELVTFPRGALTTPTEKRFDRRRSWITGGLITAAAFVAARLFGGQAADDAPNGEPIPVESRVPEG